MSNSSPNLNKSLNRNLNKQRRRGWQGSFRVLQSWGRSLLVVLSLALGAGLLLQSPQLAAEESAVPAVVNINAADAVTLAATLKGVGHSRALEIVRHREKYGPFASPDELTEVKGIGPATLDMNRQRITLK